MERYASMQEIFHERVSVHKKDVHILEKARSFYIPGGESAVILIHGFTSSPYEMQDVGTFLADQGYSVLGVRVFGHGTSPEDLEKTTYKDWTESAEEGMRQLLDAGFKRIFVCGYSFGANLSLHLAHEFPQYVRGVISIAGVVFVHLDWLIRLQLPVRAPFQRFYKKKYFSEGNLDHYLQGGVYSKIPLQSLKNFYWFIDRVTKKELPDIHAPVLILHGKKDSTVQPKSAEYFMKHLGSTNKLLHWLDDVSHDSVRNNGSLSSRDEVLKRILDFLKNN